MAHYSGEFVLEYADGEEHRFDVEITTEAGVEGVRQQFWHWLLPHPGDETGLIAWHQVIAMRVAQVQEHAPISEPLD